MVFSVAYRGFNTLGRCLDPPDLGLDPSGPGLGPLLDPFWTPFGPLLGPSEALLTYYIPLRGHIEVDPRGTWNPWSGPGIRGPPEGLRNPPDP